MLTEVITICYASARVYVGVYSLSRDERGRIVSCRLLAQIVWGGIIDIKTLYEEPTVKNLAISLPIGPAKLFGVGVSVCVCVCTLQLEEVPSINSKQLRLCRFNGFVIYFFPSHTSVIILLSSLLPVSIINKLILCNIYDRHETIKIDTIIYYIRSCEIIMPLGNKFAHSVMIVKIYLIII